MTKPSSSDASNSKLGYLYQCRYALWLALSNGENADFAISLENIDDVTIHELDLNTNELTPTELFQLKHKTKKKGGTTNAHTDIWNTIENWCKGIQSGMISLERCFLLLVTTSTATSNHAIQFLRSDKNIRNPEKARISLESAGKKSKRDIVKNAYKELMKLSLNKRKKLFDSITLLDASAKIDEIKQDIEKLLWMAVSKANLTAFRERLEGWWLDIVIDHLLDSRSDTIPLDAVCQKVHELREQFRLENLPDDLLHETVPDEEIDESDPRVFVQQLRLIGIGTGRIRKAQENHYKAVAQRSRWIRDNLIEMSEIDNFELNLIDEWSEIFEIVHDGFKESVDQEELKVLGSKIYDWSQTNAATTPTLFIRPLFQSAYLTRGSYQMLAEQVRVGWHRDFVSHFGEAK